LILAGWGNIHHGRDLLHSLRAPHPQGNIEVLIVGRIIQKTAIWPRDELYSFGETDGLGEVNLPKSRYGKTNGWIKDA
jgi:hypothetical protein